MATKPAHRNFVRFSSWDRNGDKIEGTGGPSLAIEMIFYALDGMPLKRAALLDKLKERHAQMRTLEATREQAGPNSGPVINPPL